MKYEAYMIHTLSHSYTHVSANSHTAVPSVTSRAYTKKWNSTPRGPIFFSKKRHQAHQEPLFYWLQCSCLWGPGFGPHGVSDMSGCGPHQDRKTRTHSHTHTQKHTDTHTQTHTQTHSHTHKHRPDRRVHNLPLEYLPTSYTLIPTSSLMGVKIFQKVTPWLVQIDSKWPETCSLILSAWSILAITLKFSSH